MKILFTTILTASLLGCTPKPQTEAQMEVQKNTPNLTSVAMEKNGGCLTGPIEQFGRYIGDWDIQTWTLSQTDGTTWNETAGARWNFTCVGNGIAVQDFWMPENGNIGTNLRMYDPNEKRWEVAWTASNLPGFTHIRAKEDENGNIVMNYVSPEQSPPRRITFMPPTENGWDWKLEMEYSSGGEKQWNEVFRIKATRRPK